MFLFIIMVVFIIAGFIIDGVIIFNIIRAFDDKDVRFAFSINK
jgi:hypothetical protein